MRPRKVSDTSQASTTKGILSTRCTAMNEARPILEKSGDETFCEGQPVSFETCMLYLITIFIFEKESVVNAVVRSHVKPYIDGVGDDEDDRSNAGNLKHIIGKFLCCDG